MAKRRGWKWDEANSLLKVEVDGTEVARFDATIPTAYTQTYATADKTIAAYTSNPESTAYTTVGASTDIASMAELNLLRVAYENLRVHAEDVGQALNSVIDDLQDLKLVG